VARAGETLEELLARLARDEIRLAPYDPAWPESFRAERERLRATLPEGLVGRIEHVGSTAVPGLVAKPVVDVLVEVASLEDAKARMVPVLVAQGCDYVWRPTTGDDGGPWYCWFIRRDAAGRRTHHLHVVEPHFPHWDRLRFRDWLIAHPDVAAEYAALKGMLAERHPGDRTAYTEGKTEFVVRVTEEAKRAAAAQPR
jgi:GrpB-like predicted nucleotidyltransferase (UPF0157 family)